MKSLGIISSILELHTFYVGGEGGGAWNDWNLKI